MLSKIKQSIVERGLWAKGESLLVGVSGGPDSVALLDALAQLQSDFGALTVCHLNHQLRGRASDADAEFVRKLATKYGLPAEIRSRDVKKLAAEKKISIEMAARDARLEFFGDVSHATGVWTVALAHTADDQAETVLLRLIRGAGREGLSAMEDCVLYREKLALIRPMLGVWREEVMRYLRERKLSFRKDATNLKMDFLRNRVRHKLLPMLERDFNRGIKPVLLRTAEILGEEERLLDAMAKERFSPCLHKLELRVQELMLMEVALQRRVIRLWLAFFLPASELTFEPVKAVLRLAASPKGSARVELKKGMCVTREYETVKLEFDSGKRNRARKLHGHAVFAVPGSCRCWDWRFNATMVSRDDWNAAKREGLCGSSLTAFFDADSVGDAPLTVRGRKTGDRFQPLGMSGEKKLQDFFVDEKVPQPQRSLIPLLACGERIVWVVGYRIADWAKVTEKTTRVVKLTAEKTA